MYKKNYIKKIAKVNTFDVDTVKPTVGATPTMYRDLSWLEKDSWYTNIGIDTLNSIDPFNDQSLVRKFKFNGTTADAVETAIASPASSYYHFQKDGPFDTKCLSLDLPSNNLGASNTYIDCGAMDLGSSTGFTFSAFVKFKVSTSLLTSNGSIRDQMLFKLLNTTDENNYISFQVPNEPGNTKLVISDGVQESNNTNTSDTMYQNLFLADNSWKHIVISIGRTKASLYVNGKLYNCISCKHINIPTDAKLILGDKLLLGYFNIKLLEIYKRELTQKEVTTLLNQQTFSPVICDGKSERPQGFNYLQENEQLLAVYSDKDGKIGKIELEKLEDLSKLTEARTLVIDTNNPANRFTQVNIEDVATANVFFNNINGYLDLDIVNSNYVFDVVITGYYKNNSLNPVVVEPVFKISIDKINYITFTKKIPEPVLRVGTNALDIGITVPFNLTHTTGINGFTDMTNISGVAAGKNNIVFATSKGSADPIGDYTLFIESVKLIVNEIPKIRTI